MKKILHIILFCTLVLGGQVFAAEEPNTTKNVEVLVAVKQDLIDRYKIEIDLIVERLKEKINRLESTEQKVILDNLQERILTKQGELESDDTIDTLRKEILIEILGYIAEQLTYVPTSEIIIEEPIVTPVTETPVIEEVTPAE